MSIKASEISELIKARIEDFQAGTEARNVGTVVSVTDGICRIHGLRDVMQGEMLEFPGNTFGLALNLERDSVGAVVLGNYEHITEGDTVKCTRRILDVPVGPELIGRVVNSLGQPIDGKGPVEAKETDVIEKVAPAASPAAPAAFADQAKKLASADPAVRFEGVDDLIRSKSAEAVPLLLPMARDADPFVRRLVVEGFAAWKRADVVEALLGGLGDGDEYVRDTAWRSLREVTGQKIPFEAAGGKDARARAVARWQEWWDKNKATFGS